MAPTRVGAKRDLRKVLRAARRLDIPLIVGSAGSAGARPHLEQTLEIIRDIAREDGLAFRMAVVASDMPRNALKQAIADGRVRPMDTMPPLTAADVDAASNIVGQLGLEAFRRALEADVDVVVLGRACDTGIFASIPSILGFPPGSRCIWPRSSSVHRCAAFPVGATASSAFSMMRVSNSKAWRRTDGPRRRVLPPIASTNRRIPMRCASRPAAPICAM